MRRAHAALWIETSCVWACALERGVAADVGVLIETSNHSSRGVLMHVAPDACVWI